MGATLPVLRKQHETVSGASSGKANPQHALLVVVPKRQELRGPSHPSWKGGKSIEWTGYVRIWAGPNRGKYEHTVVWEEKHGPLPEGWCVHHKNGIPWRNCISNLKAYEEAVHNRISASRRWTMGVHRITAFDLTAKDMRYLARRGVSIPKAFDAPF